MHTSADRILTTHVGSNALKPSPISLEKNGLLRERIADFPHSRALVQLMKTLFTPN